MSRRTLPGNRFRDRSKPDEAQLVLKALADPTRRVILNDLDTWVGVPMSYLAEEHVMSRQGLHKHLAVMDRAGIVIKSGGPGNSRLYYLDPRPIRRVFASLGRKFKRDMRPLRNLDKFGTPRSPFD